MCYRYLLPASQLEPVGTTYSTDRCWPYSFPTKWRTRALCAIISAFSIHQAPSRCQISSFIDFVATLPSIQELLNSFRIFFRVIFDCQLCPVLAKTLTARLFMFELLVLDEWRHRTYKQYSTVPVQYSTVQYSRALVRFVAPLRNKNKTSRFEDSNDRGPVARNRGRAGGWYGMSRLRNLLLWCPTGNRYSTVQ